MAVSRKNKYLPPCFLFYLNKSLIFVPSNSATGDGKAIATYDVFIKQDIPASLVGSKMYFCEDLTEKYRQMFPQDDTHAVVRRLVLSYVKGGDVVKD